MVTEMERSPDRYRHLDTNRFDVIVVGAGTGGLTAAALLARRGRRVLVVDSHYVAGGCATQFRRRGGYSFDVGIHYLGGCQPGGLIPRVLAACGAGVEFEELDPDGFDTLVYPDFTLRVPRGIDAFADRLAAQFPDERAGIGRVATLLRELAAARHLFVNPAAIRSLPPSSLLPDWIHRAWGDFVASCTADARLRAVLSAQSGNYALPPSRAAVSVAAGLLVHFLDGAFVPRGGGQVMADRLAAAIEEAGGRVLLRARVTRILVERGRARGVVIESPHLGRRTLHADVVIANADLKRTLLDLVGEAELPAAQIERARRWEMAPSLAVLYLGLARDLRAEGHPRTNYWIHANYDPERDYAQASAGQFPDEPSTLVSIASVKDPGNARYAPKGVTNVEVLGLVPSDAASWGTTEEAVLDGSYRAGAEYRARKERFAATLLRAAGRALPDIESRVVFHEMSTPLSHRRFTGASGGTSYGIAATPSQSLGQRPGARTPIAGLYVCGASCRAGHGIAGVMTSGVIAAAEVVGRRLLEDVFGPAPSGSAV